MTKSNTPVLSGTLPKAPRTKKVPAAKQPINETIAPEGAAAAMVGALQAHLHTAPGTINHELEALFEPPKPLGQATEVFDEYELASMREMEATAEAVQRARRAAEIKPPADWDKKTCYDCGLDIEQGRLRLGYYTCIVCERQKEVRSKQYRN
jgi:hypothetical protein